MGPDEHDLHNSEALSTNQPASVTPSGEGADSPKPSLAMESQAPASTPSQPQSTPTETPVTAQTAAAPTSQEPLAATPNEPHISAAATAEPFAADSAQPVAPLQPAVEAPKRKLFPLLAIAGGILLLGLLAALLVPKLFGVSQADYKKADAVMQETRAAYNKAGVTYVSSASSLEDLKKETASLKSSIQLFSSKFDELGQTKAIKRDSDLAKLYKTVNEKKVQFNTAADSVVEMYEKVLPAVSKATASSGQGTAALTSMRSALESIQGLKDVDSKAFAARAVAKLKELEGLATKMQAGRPDSNTTRAYLTSVSDLSKIMSDWQTTMEKKANKGDLKDELTQLSEKISSKLER